MAELRADKAAAERFAKLIQKQETALEQYAWDGAWFLRGLDDEAQPIGTHSAEHARIWLNAQSWMVIAGACSREQQLCAMDSAAHQFLVGNDNFRLSADGFFAVG